MISFRFHVVSITAVFLAIAIGVVVGSTYVDRAIVENLERRIDTVSENLDDRKRENDALEAELDDVKTYATASAEFAVAGRLTDVPVLVLAARGVDANAAEELTQLARRAGAVVPGVVWLEPKWGLATPEERSELAALLGAAPRASRDELQERAWTAIADALVATEGEPIEPEGEEAAASSEILTDLQAASFVTVDALSATAVPLADLRGAGPRVLILTGPASVEDLDSILPMVIAAPVGAGLGTVVADAYVDDETEDGRGAGLAALLTDGVRERVIALDHADLVEGRVAAILALAAVADGVVGHVGYGDGADGVLPGWTPP